MFKYEEVQLEYDRFNHMLIKCKIVEKTRKYNFFKEK